MILLSGKISLSCELLSSLFVKYKDFYVLTGGEESDLECYTSQNLKKRLLRKFDSTKLSIANHRRKDGKNPLVVFKPEAYSLINFKTENEKTVIRNCASILRKAITTATKTPLKTDTTDDILSGEVAVPEQVNYYYKKLYSKNNKYSSKRIQKVRQPHH